MEENEINWKLIVAILWVLAISGLFGYAWLTCESFRNFVCWVVHYCFRQGNGGGEGGHEAAAAGDQVPQEGDALLAAADESQGGQEAAAGDQVPQEGDALLAAADESRGGQEEAAADDDETLTSSPKGKEPVASSSTTASKTKEEVEDEEKEEKDEVKEELQEEEEEEGVHEEEENRGGGADADAAAEGPSTTRTYVYTGIHSEDERGRKVWKIIRKPVTGSGSGGGPSSS